ncbi:MAG: serine/threonine transporter SstT [Succinivibrionaceae bacterium]|nr:serine/threonine transporter SstT [Succinivibrionaceae bacterium]
MSLLKNIVRSYNGAPLVLRIIAGIIVGTCLAILCRKFGKESAPVEIMPLSLCGACFIAALKGTAPILVLFLVADALIGSQKGFDSKFAKIICLYIVSTLLAAVVAVTVSFLLPVSIDTSGQSQIAEGQTLTLSGILKDAISGVFSNPAEAVANGKFLSILFWAGVIGIALKTCAGEATRSVIHDLSVAFTRLVAWIINLAPIGIMGLVFDAVSSSGMDIFRLYGSLVLSLVISMTLVALVTNPLIAGIAMRANPYPLIFTALKESGVTAFFTRSSAANIPINLRLCRRLRINEEIYSVSIPLGATVNMCGAAVTITVMTLATVNSMGLEVSFLQAALLCGISVLAACGTSGVAGGSLLLIPLACSVFGIPYDTAMVTVGIGFIIGVVQDSMETALNSSSDVVFTAAAEYCELRKEGKPIPDCLALPSEDSGRKQ